MTIRQPVTKDVRASEKNPIARLTIGWVPGQTESMVQLTSPIAQHIAFYVSNDRKPEFIAELRAALDAWEKSL